MSTFAKIIIFVSLTILLLHVWAAVSPSHYNWGFHFFAFYNSYFSIFILFLSSLILIPRVQTRVLNVLETSGRKIKNNLPIWTSFAVAVLALIVIAVLFPARLHLLGDGSLILREISGIRLGDELPATFNHQLLAGLVIKFIKNIFETGQLQNPENVFRIIDIFSGILFLGIIFYLLKFLKVSPAEKYLTGSLLFFTAGSQFFFGYVENYSLLFVVTTAYLATSWLKLERNLHIFIPLTLFGIMVGLHIGSIIFLPTIILLIYHNWKNARSQTIVILLVFILASAATLLAYFNRIEIILQRTIIESKWNFLPLYQSNAFFSNPILSSIHLVDWLNANFLFSPFALPLAAVLLVVGRKKIQWKDPILFFLLTATLLGLVFTFITFFALGMARDWDFMASFFLPLILLNLYLFTRYNNVVKSKNSLLVIVLLSFFHWIGWIGLNSDEVSSYERIKMLDNPNLLGFVPRLNYYETLGSYNWAQKNYTEANMYFERYIELDSTNPRILGNISAIYSKLNNKEKTFWALRRAADVNTPNPAIFINLGVAYSQRGDTATAMKMYKKALSMDSTRSKAYANLGSLLMRQNNFIEAANNFSKAIDYGLYDSLLFKETATVFFQLGEYKKAITYFDAYLSIVPTDERVRYIRNKLNEVTNSRDNN
jgi:Tfp pilus assembly protein PilF